MQFIYQHSIQLITLLVLSIALVACGEGDQEARNRNGAEAPAGAPQAVGAANTAGTPVNVVAKDFEFLLDTNSAEAGAVTFIVTNEGSMPHDFAITIDGKREKTPMIQPGASASLTVDLQPGTYDYICTVPGHDILGMKGTFTVN
ncbi:MAG: cupredoxin domain-containing protein [Caldilineaceae bacterium]|nr:cupredoxin domain-containing protein [Caldilineaceae bacterium]